MHAGARRPNDLSKSHARGIASADEIGAARLVVGAPPRAGRPGGARTTTARRAVSLVTSAKRPPSDASDAVDDGTLVDRVRSGSVGAFDELVRRYTRRALTVAYRVMGHREDAEDLVQDAFVQAYERIDSFDRNRPFGPWLMRIVLNRGLNARRARTLRTAAPIHEEMVAARGSPQHDAERAEVQARFERAVAALPPRQRAVVMLFDVEGYSSVEIAEMMGIPQPTVRWHLHRARKVLRVALASLKEDSTDD